MTEIMDHNMGYDNRVGWSPETKQLQHDAVHPGIIGPYGKVIVWNSVESLLKSFLEGRERDRAVNQNGSPCFVPPIWAIF
jgi:hypothetical protein